MKSRKKRLRTKAHGPIDSKTVMVPPAKFIYIYIPGAENELADVDLPQDLVPTVVGYVDGAVGSPQADKKKDSLYAKTKTLFGIPLKLLPCSQALEAANLILHGDEKQIEDALALIKETIKEKPLLLHFETEGTDRLGRKVRGTLLQIAAMAGDVDLRDGITEEKQHGMVERIAALGYLSKEEIAEQLQCITSLKAQASNEKRNQRVLAAIKKFGESLIESKIIDAEENFEDYFARCKSLIDQLEVELKPDITTPITQGYVFDPAILQAAMQWFEENVSRFVEKYGGGFLGRDRDWFNNKSDVFWMNGIGKLQSKLSSRDAQVVRAGIGKLVDDTIVPARTLNNADGSSHFYNLVSGLGRRFYLGYDGGYWGGWRQTRGALNCAEGLEKVCQVKTQHLYAMSGSPKALLPRR